MWVPVVRSLVAVLHSLASQDVARANAGLAAIRLQNRRRQYDDVDAYLRQLALEHERTSEEAGYRRATG